MSYNFSNCYNRRSEGSRKWEVIPDCQDCEENQIAPMTVADLDLPTAPEIKEELNSYIEESVLGYSKPTDEYFKAIRNYMKKNYQYSPKAEWTIPTPGIGPALAASVRAYRERGEGVSVFPPVYNPFYEVIKEQGREILKCPLIEENQRYEINFELFKELAEKKEARMLILCSPHNPSGRVWTEAELKRISEIAQENHLIVISDEIHADMTLDNQKHHLYASISKEAAAHSLVCTSPSKSYNIAGLQNSNIFISNPDLRENFESEMGKIGINCPNVLGLKATEAAYTKAEDWFDELMVLLNKNVNKTVEHLERIDSRFKVMRPDSSFLVWVNIKDFNLSNAEFMEKLKEKNIYLTNGNLYGEEGEGYIRINIGMPRHILEANLERFKELEL